MGWEASVVGTQSAEKTLLQIRDRLVGGDVSIDSLLGQIADSLAQLPLVEAAAPNFAITQPQASTASAAGLAARATRRHADLVNTSLSDTIYIGAGTVTALNSFRIGPGESYQWRATAAFNFLASAGTPKLNIMDYYD